MKIVFCQISTDLINADISPDIFSQFYDKFWESKEPDGFYKPRDFWEIPLWIAELSYTLPAEWERELQVIHNLDATINNLNWIDADIICFSCLDVNKSIIENIIKSYRGRANIVVGGYVKPDVPGCIWWHDSIKAFCQVYDIDYRYGTDYSLFTGYKTIPRLTMSTGCKHRCKFCTVPNSITEITADNIYKQIDSFKPLDYRLIYLNDKTFGQADNYKLLDGLYTYIKTTYNPDFRGFIIQTTCNQITKPEFIDFVKSAKIKYVELGIESCNDAILSDMKKPQNLKLIHKALKLCNDHKVNVIANIIIGLPGEIAETYRRTIETLQQYKLYSLNIYNLAIYDDAALSNEVKASGDDNNELIKDKSYHNDSDRIAIDGFYKAVYQLGFETIK